jgi:flavodoxin
MKRIVLIAIMTMFLPDMNTQAQTPSGTKVLVAYFSHSGNTRAMARQIAEATGGDLFEIVPAAAYPAEYGAVVDQAKKEIGGGVRPALKGRLPDVGAYDVIFVGSPCWWSTVAPPVTTFLADCDWAGKTVVPFMTHEGSRMGRSEEDIRKLCAGATLLGGLPLRGGAVKDSRDAVRKWVQGLNLTK